MKNLATIILLFLLSSCSHAFYGIYSDTTGDKLIDLYNGDSHSQYEEFISSRDTILLECERLPTSCTEISRQDGVFKGQRVTFYTYVLKKGICTFAATNEIQSSRKSSPFWQKMGY